jgi:hypothetical protein
MEADEPGRNKEKGTATVDYIIGVVSKLFEDVKAGYKTIKKITPESVDALHKKIIDNYKDFAQQHPIVVRHIVYEQKFYPKVMEKYLLHLSNHPVTNREQQLETQTEYLVYMLRHEHPRTETKKIYQYRNDVLKEIKDSDEKLQKCIETAAEEMANDKEKGNQDRRERLREHFLKQLTHTS